MYVTDFGTFFLNLSSIVKIRLSPGTFWNLSRAAVTFSSLAVPEPERVFSSGNASGRSRPTRRSSRQARALQHTRSASFMIAIPNTYRVYICIFGPMFEKDASTLDFTVRPLSGAVNTGLLLNSDGGARVETSQNLEKNNLLIVILCP
jgi:hypothetical protein